MFNLIGKTLSVVTTEVSTTTWFDAAPGVKYWLDLSGRPHCRCTCGHHIEVIERDSPTCGKCLTPLGVYRVCIVERKYTSQEAK